MYLCDIVAVLNLMQFSIIFYLAIGEAPLATNS